MCPDCEKAVLERQRLEEQVRALTPTPLAAAVLLARQKWYDDHGGKDTIQVLFEQVQKERDEALQRTTDQELVIEQWQAVADRKHDLLNEALAKLAQAEQHIVAMQQTISRETVDLKQRVADLQECVAQLHDLLHQAEAALAALEDAHSDYSQLALRNEITAVLDKARHGR